MRNNLLLLSFLIIAVFSACKREYITIHPEQKPIVDTTLVPQIYIAAEDNSDNLIEDIEFSISDSVAVAVLPHVTDHKRFILRFNLPDSTRVFVDSIEQLSGITENDFCTPKRYTFQKGKISKTINVSISNYTNLPILYINTISAVNSKDNWIEGTMNIDGNGDGLTDSTIFKASFKGRGNSTWGMPKKPYAIKLEDKCSLFGMPAAKRWVLLANYADKTLIRTSIGFEMASSLTKVFTPRQQFVDVIMNGEFIGNYMLTERIDGGDTRLNLEKLSKNDVDPAIISGGYLLEIDQRLDAEKWFKTQLKDTPIIFKEPENPNTQQLNYISTYINDFEKALFSIDFCDKSKGYAQYIDMESFVDWYLVNEVTKNNDAILFSSVFLHKHRNGKLKMGPVWDFDISLGNINYNGNDNPEGWWIGKSSWYSRLLEDPAFVALVKNRWSSFKSTYLNSVSSRINDKARALNLSQEQNFKKWEITYQQVWPNAVVLGTYQNEINYLKTWLGRRINWIDKEIDNI